MIEHVKLPSRIMIINRPKDIFVQKEGQAVLIKFKISLNIEKYIFTKKQSSDKTIKELLMTIDEPENFISKMNEILKKMQ